MIATLPPVARNDRVTIIIDYMKALQHSPERLYKRSKEVLQRFHTCVCIIESSL
jgi:hypothetical protein